MTVNVLPALASSHNKWFVLMIQSSRSSGPGLVVNRYGYSRRESRNLRCSHQLSLEWRHR